MLSPWLGRFSVRLRGFFCGNHRVGAVGLVIIKKINTNAAIGIDSAGREVVLLSKGIGFPPTPYDFTDLARIDRSFYDVDPRYIDMLASLSQPILLASADLIEQAEINLDCELNANLPFTLADHLQFALDRMSKGIDLTAPLAYDVQHLYPNEYELGVLALDIVQDYTGERLPDNEAVNVALHLINAEVEVGGDHAAMLALQVIGEIDDLLEQKLQIKLDKGSFRYSRFTMHLRYLVQRLSSGKQANNNTNGVMLHTMAREYPNIYLCTCEVADYLNKTFGWRCNDEEKLYLMMHINRVREKED